MSAATLTAPPVVTTTTGVPVSYERISRFRVVRHGIDAEVVRNIDRQATDNADAAATMGLGDVHRHFKDDDRSASQFATKPREEWLELLAYVRSGAVSHVLVWLFDRAARTTEGTEALLAACREGGALIVQTAGAPVVANPHNPDDVFRLKLAGLLAEYEVAKMSVRQKRAKKAEAKAGKPHGGRRRFGYEPGMVAIRHEEAEVIRDIASRLLAGETLRSCAAWLNDHEIPTPTGKAGPGAWTGSNLGTMMQRPHLAGLRVHGGKITGHATWEPILTEATRDSLVHLLADPDRRTSYTNARVYLLAGLARCAECGELLRGRPTQAKGSARAYACVTGRHCHRPVQDVDAIVGDRIVARLEELDVSGALVDHQALDQAAALRRQQDAVEGRSDELAAAYAVGEIKLAAYTAAMDALDGQRAALAEALEGAREAAGRPQAALHGMTGPGAREAWDEASLGRKRAIIDLLATVELRGAGENRRRPLAPEDVVVDFNRPGAPA